MAKKTLKPSTMLYPLPAVMVSCGTMEESNIITIGWTGIINSEPPRTYVSVMPKRYSHDIIEKNMEFVINLTSKELAKATDYCGCTTGAKVDKFKETGLTKIPAELVKCPMIEEAPINLECKIFEIKRLGSHDMYMADIVAVHVNEDLLDENGRVALEKAGLISYSHGQYYPVSGKTLGRFGFSVMKPKTAKRLRREAAEKRQSKEKK